MYVRLVLIFMYVGAVLVGVVERAAEAEHSKYTLSHSVISTVVAVAVGVATAAVPQSLNIT